jgi:hypothetical protein
MSELASYRVRPSAVKVAVLLSIWLALTALSVFELIVHADSAARRAMMFSCAVCFGSALAYSIRMYGLWIDIDGQSVSIRHLSQHWILQKRSIHLAKTTSNGWMRSFHLTANRSRFKINENFENAARFVEEVNGHDLNPKVD